MKVQSRSSARFHASGRARTFAAALLLNLSGAAPLSSGLAALALPTLGVALTHAGDARAAGSIGRYTSGADGFVTNSFWYDTGKEVVVFDAQFTPALAEALLAEIKGKTKNPIKYLVITHPNPDKFNGAKVFQKAGAKVVASKATAQAIPGVHEYKKYYFTQIAKMFKEADYPKPPTVDITFDKTLSLPLDAGKVELKVLDHRGVSSTQTVAFIPEQQALLVGDLVHYKTHAWLEGGIVTGKAQPALAEWQLALDELLAYPKSTVYGGRGNPASVEQAVAEQKRYLKKLDEIVTEYVKGLGTRKAELAGTSSDQHFKAIAAKASTAFPDYQFPFMIEYGVYGLAQAKAAL